MGNYRDVMSRRGCLATALAWTAIPALSAGFILLYTPDLPPQRPGVQRPAPAASAAGRCRSLAPLAGIRQKAKN